MEGGRLEGGLEKRARLGSRLSCMCGRGYESKKPPRLLPQSPKLKPQQNMNPRPFSGPWSMRQEGGLLGK